MKHSKTYFLHIFWITNCAVIYFLLCQENLYPSTYRYFQHNLYYILLIFLVCCCTSMWILKQLFLYVYSNHIFRSQIHYVLHLAGCFFVTLSRLDLSITRALNTKKTGLNNISCGTVKPYHIVFTNYKEGPKEAAII